MHKIEGCKKKQTESTRTSGGNGRERNQQWGRGKATPGRQRNSRRKLQWRDTHSTLQKLNSGLSCTPHCGHDRHRHQEHTATPCGDPTLETATYSWPCLNTFADRCTSTFGKVRPCYDRQTLSEITAQDDHLASKRTVTTAEKVLSFRVLSTGSKTCRCIIGVSPQTISLAAPMRAAISLSLLI